jgi:hypothetical protein
MNQKEDVVCLEKEEKTTPRLTTNLFNTRYHKVSKSQNGSQKKLAVDFVLQICCLFCRGENIIHYC